MKEKLFLSNQPLQSTMVKHVATGNIHQYSAKVIEIFHHSASRVPRYVTGDGNCLFNSVSVILCGNESIACELRVRTCVELFLNFEYYKKHHQCRDFICVSPDLEETCRKRAVDREYSSVFMMQALSSVVGRELVSVYPAMNGLLDNCLGILNTVLVPRIPTSRRSGERIYVMWTRMAGTIPHPPDRIWTPNHFVPLIQKPDVQSVPLTSSPIIVDNPSPDFKTSPFQTTTYSKLDTSSPLRVITPEHSPTIPIRKGSSMDDLAPITLSPYRHPDDQSSSSESDQQKPTVPPPDRSPCNTEIVSSEVCDQSLLSMRSSSGSNDHQSASNEVTDHSTNPSTNQVLPGRFLDVKSLCELIELKLSQS